MASSISKLDQALRDLLEAYTEIEEDLEAKCGDDEDAFSSAIVESLETAIESALDEQDSSTAFFATVLSSLSEALESLDPAAFEQEDEEEEEDEDDGEVEDVDLDEDEELDLEDEDDGDDDDE